MKKTNPLLQETVLFLEKSSKKNKAGVWKDLAKRLNKPKRGQKTVNLGKISKYSEKDQTVVVPGKVLSAGEIKHPVTVAAFSFSKQAQEKILKQKGKTISLEELVKKNPSGKGVKVIG